MPEATLLFNERVRAIQQALEQRFIYRKLGLCYDYASDPEEFPRKTLPTAKDAREGKPNGAGLGTGMAECARNGALLFDGYLLRLELGIADANEERIFDRLIGGLIRIATAAPKGFLVRGLTPDGRGFYSESCFEAHLFWAFSAWRGYHTAAVAQESQGKIQNIATRWIARLDQDEFRIPPLQGAAPPVDLNLQNWERGPVLLALLAVAASVTGEDRWRTLYASKAEENGHARLAWDLPSPLERSSMLLPLQLALHILAAWDEDTTRQTIVREKMRQVAESAAGLLSRYEECKAPILEETPDLDWRGLPAGASGGSEDFRLPTAWRRILHEAETVRPSVEAGLALLLAGDRDLAEIHAQALAGCLQQISWDKLWLAGALTPAVGLHARGVEMGLWDEGLLDPVYRVDGSESLVAPYLAPDFDDTHPDVGGHTEVPPKKRQKEEELRRAAQAAENGNDKPTKDRPRSRGRRRRRRRKKKQ